ncbi:MAG: hypothetical protein EBY39_10550 [Flavobacteriia bacterium]|nr:hypothetical protein [Flavobacteriia bacterium]
MKDEILVEEKYIKNRAKPLYVITSFHSKAINNMTRKKSIDEVDLQSLSDLGYAIALNKLDAYGNKTYIKHNLRTRRERRNK